MTIEQEQRQTGLIHPLTGEFMKPAPADLFVEVVAEKVTNKGGADQVTFLCPFCKRRNKQNIRRAINLLRPNIAAFRCQCSRTIYVRKRAVDVARVNLARR